jgi:hypothetical protein
MHTDWCVNGGCCSRVQMFAWMNGDSHSHGVPFPQAIKEQWPKLFRE